MHRTIDNPKIRGLRIRLLSRFCFGFFFMFFIFASLLIHYLFLKVDCYIKLLNQFGFNRKLIMLD